MLRPLTDPLGFRCAYWLLSEDLTVEELTDRLSADADAVHDSLSALADVGVVERRVRVRDDVSNEYYRATIIAETLLSCVAELMTREHLFASVYDSDSDGL